MSTGFEAASRDRWSTLVASVSVVAAALFTQMPLHVSKYWDSRPRPAAIFRRRAVSATLVPTYLQLPRISSRLLLLSKSPHGIGSTSARGPGNGMEVAYSRDGVVGTFPGNTILRILFL